MATKKITEVDVVNSLSDSDAIFVNSSNSLKQISKSNLVIKGTDGGYYAPAVDAAGNLTWTASKTDMPAVDGANIKGPKGDTGAAGPKGDTGATGPAGANGKSAYAYAVEGGYTGTEAEFAAKLAKEKFANPNAITFTGAVTGSYDGSAPLSVEIPSGGGSGGGSGSEYVEVFSTTIEEEIAVFEHAFTAEEIAILADAKRIYVRIYTGLPSNASADDHGTCSFFLRGYGKNGTTIPYSIKLGDKVACIPKANVSWQTYCNVFYTMDITGFDHYGELFQTIVFQNSNPTTKSTHARGDGVPFSQYKTNNQKTSFYAEASNAFSIGSIFTIYALR